MEAEELVQRQKCGRSAQSEDDQRAPHAWHQADLPESEMAKAVAEIASGDAKPTDEPRIRRREGTAHTLSDFPLLLTVNCHFVNPP